MREKGIQRVTAADLGFSKGVSNERKLQEENGIINYFPNRNGHEMDTCNHFVTQVWRSLVVFLTSFGSYFHILDLSLRDMGKVHFESDFQMSSRGTSLIHGNAFVFTKINYEFQLSLILLIRKAELEKEQ